MSQSSGAKVTRRFGHFSSDPNTDKAASLFDSVYPRQANTSNQPSATNLPLKRNSPKKVELPTEAKSNSPSSTTFSSPTASIPDIGLEKSGSSGSDDDEDEAQGNSQSSSASLNTSMRLTSISDRDLPSDSGMKKPGIVEGGQDEQQPRGLSTEMTSTQKRRQNKFSLVFEEEEEEDIEDEEEEEMTPPQIKRTRSDPIEQATSSEEAIVGDKSLFPAGTKKENKPVYKHKWAFDDEEDEEVVTGKDESQRNKAKPSYPSVSARAPMVALRGSNPSTERFEGGTRIGNVKEAHQCLESGEHDDYRQDIDYVLSTLLDPASTANLKCLSVISLAKKCVSAEFRQFFRTENFFPRTIKALTDSASCPSVAISTSAVIYLMARDKVCVSLDATSLRLLSQMLKMEKPKNNDEYNKYSKMVWDVMQEWLDKTRAGLEQEVQFDFTEATLSPSLLILESLVYICTRSNNDQSLKNEMLNLGVLQWIVSKVDKTVLRLLHEKVAEPETLQCLITLERCFWILETCTVYNKKNQAYLISHRGSALIQSCGRLMAFCHETVDRLGDKDSAFVKANITCLCRISGILTNLSHENELCSTKLGQMNSFLPLCMSTFTYLAPRFAPDNKRFDLAVLMSSLLVNLVERCNSNRRKVIELTVPVYNVETNTVSEQPSLNALAQIFLMHESAARTVDEELDRDLILEDAPNESGTEEDSDDDDGRLHRLPAELTEDEMVATVQRAMNKASAHMEDSVVASYTALLVGCLMQQNEESVAEVKSQMPNGKLTPMVEQLQRFLDFMKISNIRNSGNRSVERIIDLLDQLNG